uniref:Uncharacterized protein n=1 Tax=Rhizophora mucronata TaxID=61149 RepID=A0A2P2PNN2_RHIMU
MVGCMNMVACVL